MFVICEEDLFKSMCYLVLREVDCVSEGVEALPAIVLPQSVLVWSLVIILVILMVVLIIIGHLGGDHLVLILIINNNNHQDYLKLSNVSSSFLCLDNVIYFKFVKSHFILELFQ